MYLESLRYLAGFGATPDYLPAAPNLDSSYIPGLNVATTSASAQNPSIIPNAQWCANFAVSSSFPWMSKHVGLPVTYGAYTLFALLSFLFVRAWVHETKGVELEAMQG